MMKTEMKSASWTFTKCNRTFHTAVFEHPKAVPGVLCGPLLFVYSAETKNPNGNKRRGLKKRMISWSWKSVKCTMKEDEKVRWKHVGHTQETIGCTSWRETANVSREEGAKSKCLWAAWMKRRDTYRKKRKRVVWVLRKHYTLPRLYRKRKSKYKERAGRRARDEKLWRARRGVKEKEREDRSERRKKWSTSHSSLSNSRRLKSWDHFSLLPPRSPLPHTLLLFDRSVGWAGCP